MLSRSYKASSSHKKKDSYKMHPSPKTGCGGPGRPTCKQSGAARTSTSKKQQAAKIQRREASGKSPRRKKSREANRRATNRSRVNQCGRLDPKWTTTETTNRLYHVHTD